MNRTPIKVGYSLIVMGCDPGIRNTGLSIVGLDNNNQYTCLSLAGIETVKQSKKALQQLRLNVDDFRRYGEIYSELEKFYNTFVLSYLNYFTISAIAIESYTVMGPIFDKKKNKSIMGNNAWKSAVVYGGILFWAMCRDLYVAPFLPSDVKKRFGKYDKSKEGVQLSLENEVLSFKERIKQFPKTKQEHLSDATAHAVLLIEEIQKNKVLFGGLNG